MKLTVKPDLKLEIKLTADIKGDRIPLYTAYKYPTKLSEIKLALDEAYHYITKQLED